ncbi:MAG: DUF6093 family protein [Propionicimonas sp.]
MIGDDIARALPELRAHAESLMRDTVLVERPGLTTTDPETGQPTTPYATIYSGQAKIQSTDQYESSPEVGTAIHTLQRSLLHVPVGAFRAETGDRVTVKGSIDPLLIDVRLRVVQIAPFKSWATAYRMFIERET